MMGISCEGPVCAYGDNHSALSKTTTPKSTLKKKSVSLAYHLVRKDAAMDNWRKDHVNVHDNEADLLTKFLPFGEKRRKFVRKALMRIYGSS